MPGMGAGRDRAWGELRDAETDRRSGAAEIALRGAEALAALPPSDLQEAVAALLRGHPSMAPLWRLATEVLGADEHPGTAARFARGLLAGGDRITAVAAPILRVPRLVLHSYSSTLVAVVRSTGAQALCARSEPGGEGRETARSLQEAGLDARLIEDHAALGAAASGVPVVTGADAVGPGGVVNKVGTRVLAEASRRGGAGCTVLAGTSKLLAVDLPAPRPFERIPLDLLERVVTEERALAPGEALLETGRFPLHPELAALLAELS
jgi:translation initiation factor 2B subunit (eIF-2B alpha/beta/delta family)